MNKKQILFGMLDKIFIRVVIVVAIIIGILLLGTLIDAITEGIFSTFD